MSGRQAVGERFGRVVGEGFAFLTRDMGFVRGETHVHAPEMWTTFQKGAVDVTVSVEIGGAPWVTIGLSEAQPGGRSKRRAYDVGLLAPGTERGPAIPAMVGEADWPRVLGELATLLRSKGQRLLQGEPSAFDALEPQAAERARRRERALFGGKE